MPSGQYPAGPDTQQIGPRANCVWSAVFRSAVVQRKLREDQAEGGKWRWEKVKAK